jgi:hypothetical protein
VGAASCTTAATVNRAAAASRASSQCIKLPSQVRGFSACQHDAHFCPSHASITSVRRVVLPRTYVFQRIPYFLQVKCIIDYGLRKRKNRLSKTDTPEPVVWVPVQQAYLSKNGEVVVVPGPSMAVQCRTADIIHFTAVLAS